MRNHRILIGVLFLACLAILGQPATAPAVPYRERDYLDNPKVVDWNATVEFPKLTFGYSWKDALKWFAEQANLPLTAIAPIPDSSFTFTAPTNSKYTLTEIYDILNEVLQTQHRTTIMRGGNGLTLVDAGAELPDHLVPRLSMADLKDRGRTEVVEVVIKMPAGASIEEAGLDIQRAVGTFGRVTPLDDNRVIVRGQVASLRRVLMVCDD
jgi:hypothetical protein